MEKLQIKVVNIRGLFWNVKFRVKNYLTCVVYRLSLIVISVLKLFVFCMYASFSESPMIFGKTDNTWKFYVSFVFFKVCERVCKMWSGIEWVEEKSKNCSETQFSGRWQNFEKLFKHSTANCYFSDTSYLHQNF